ncbi:type II toxin-antitoxin system VapC family toxin [soil metagenome]
MILFVDASAMVALIAREAGCEALEQRMAEATELLCSPVSLWETVTALCRSHKVDVAVARKRVASFVADFGFRLVQIGSPESEIALDGYARFGKGIHPAGLNMGDCFAYACAKTNEAHLLYKGDDFARTDLA